MKGEIQELKSTVNTMVDQLNGFASEVSRVAREVGTEGKLGRQAQVPGAAGLWRDLTNNVNQLAANLTAQVRAISDVATAVTTGDLTRFDHRRGDGRSRAPERQHQRDDREDQGHDKKEQRAGLVENQSRQVHTHAARPRRSRDRIEARAFGACAPLQAQQGVFYIQTKEGTEVQLELIASYASNAGERLTPTLRIGEGSRRAMRL